MNAGGGGRGGARLGINGPLDSVSAGGSVGVGFPGGGGGRKSFDTTGLESV